MELTYIDFLNKVKDWFAAANTGRTCTICLPDEIELNPETLWPACFITPQPWQSRKETLAQYVCRVYLVDIISGDRSNRFEQISQMYNWAQSALQTSPPEFNGLVWPMQITPVVLWDLQGDGLYIDITLINNVPCF